MTCTPNHPYRVGRDLQRQPDGLSPIFNLSTPPRPARPGSALSPMAEKVRMAMQGQWMSVRGRVFDITEDMTMVFEGLSCNILDRDEQIVANFSEKDAVVVREVRPGERCYILYARVKFVRVA
ncbi:hypothetical protein BJX76DRAFT_354849 [Aspergillus varians]